jgi:hypothetical protein
MIEGGLDGALSGGMSRFGGGAMRVAGSVARGGGAAVAAGAAKLFAGGSRNGSSSGPARPSQPTAGQPGGGSGYQPRHRAADNGERETSTAGGYEGRRRACDGHSFDPATLVLLVDGSTKPIGEVELGDEVVATDPESGERAAKPVTQVHVNVDRELTNLTVRDQVTGELSVLKTTQNHPFWDATDRRWVAAGQLTAGHRLLVHDDKRLEGDSTGAGVGGGGPGTEVVVVGVDNFVGEASMRDLTIADIHTYYVLAGNTPVLVHNTGPCAPAIQATAKGNGNSTRRIARSVGDSVDEVNSSTRLRPMI